MQPNPKLFAMKGALIALFIGLALLVLLCFRMDIYRSKGTIDIHLHNTYFVLSHASVVVFILLFLGTFFAKGGISGRYFKSKLFRVLVVIFLSIDTYYMVSFYRAYNDTEITQVSEECPILSDAADTALVK